MNKLEKAKEVIENLSNMEDLDKDIRNLVHSTLRCAEEGYILIQWPESQNFMDKSWFKNEAILDVEAKFGSSAYFIPIKRYLEE